MITTPRPEYPRPILTRPDWLNLNGEWRFAVDRENRGLKEKWFGSDLPGNQLIRVPYPINSSASGVSEEHGEPVVWYQREFTVPPDWCERRLCLRIGASDYHTMVMLNGHRVGEHSGGYSPFVIDIQDFLQDGANVLTVRVQDSLSWTQPRGKQAGTTRWPVDYDGVTGIWQTVWLEPLPETSIESICTEFNLSTSTLKCHVDFSQQVEGELTVELVNGDDPVVIASTTTGLRAEGRLELTIPDPILWSPAQPHLYDLRVTLVPVTGEPDRVASYCGLREIAIDDGCLKLNGEPLYLRGVLDQGYFPEGWYTALDDAALKTDVELTLALGFNCTRKHQKAEDPRYLYWADRLGLLVWAEMPSGRIFSTELVQALTKEWLELVKRDRGHPSVMAWVPFNESWGVWHQSIRPAQRAFVEGIVGLTRALDTSRPVVGNDGWEYSAGDLWTLHVYEEGRDLETRIGELIGDPGSLVVPNQEGSGGRAGALHGAVVAGLPILLTECGGIGFGSHGEDDFSYGDLPDTEAELETRIRQSLAAITAADSLQGYVWTQLTDVQQEINGLLYFDREPKLPIETLRGLFGENPAFRQSGN